MTGEGRRMLSTALFFIGGAGLVWLALTLLQAAVGAWSVAGYVDTAIRVGGPPAVFALVMIAAGIGLRPR